MRRRRTPIATDSLDLLLDTITNTFGGILLLALLLVLLIRETTGTQPGSDSTQSRNAEVLEARLAELTAERATLQQTVSAQQVTTQLTLDDASQQLIGQLTQLVQSQAQFKADLAREAGSRRELEQDIEAHQQKVAVLESRLSKLLEELSHAEDVLKNEQASRTRTMDLPREQFTDKRMAVVVVKGQELFLLRNDADVAGFQVNSLHFESCSRGQADVVLSSGDSYRVRAGAGVPLETAALEGALRSIDGSTYFLTIVIDPDSFEGFANLRAACVQLGLEHKILPVEDFPVTESASSRRHTAQ